MSNSKSAVVRLRLTDAELKVIDEAWARDGFKSRSAYLRHCARAQAGLPSATPALLEAMRGSRSQLSTLARILNKAVRDRGEDHDEAASNETGDDLLADLAGEVRELRNSFLSYIDAAKNERRAQ